jgi:predicted hydrocarbon binding protein
MGRVQGIILDELEKYVGREFGEAGLSRMYALTGRGPGGYQLDGAYPDEEVLKIIGDIVAATGTAPDVVFEQFGEALVPGLLDVYGMLVNPRWSFLDFLVNTEGVMHKSVTLAVQSSEPPGIEVQRIGPDEVAVVYRSRRRLCFLAKGIVRGAAAYYRVEATIGETHCMHRGDPHCLITVSASD